MRPLSIRVERGPMVAPRAWATENTFERVQGWLKRDSVEQGEGLLICPCASIHTLGLGFSIDLVFLDRRGKVLKLVPEVGPSRLVWGPWLGVAMPWLVQVLELPAGTLSSTALRVAQRLIFEARPLS